MPKKVFKKLETERESVFAKRLSVNCHGGHIIINLRSPVKSVEYCIF